MDILADTLFDKIKAHPVTLVYTTGTFAGNTLGINILF